MQIAVTEFKRRLKELQFASEPIFVSKRGKIKGVYVSENAKAAAFPKGLDLSNAAKERQ